MNRIHTFTKVLLAAMGLFLAISTLPQLLSPIYMLTQETSIERLGAFLAQFSVTGLFLAAIYYLLWVKQERLATRMVGTEPPQGPESPLQWLPVAFRLVCVASGLYCLYTLVMQTSRYLLSVSYRNSFTDPVRIGPTVEQLLTWAVMLALGLYLCCGAPHFVRWQVNKTLEQCRQWPEAD
jgi:hypothetical protein